MPSLKIHHLTKSFHSHNVLKDFSLTIPDKTSMIIMGASGSGKSVLMRCILGLMSYDEGSIMWNNHLMNENFLKTWGVVFQFSALLMHLSVYDNIAFPLIMAQNITVEDVKDRVFSVAEDVSLNESILQRYPHEISGGMQRRVAIARALVTRPRFLICDEPTTGLDPALNKTISQLIRTLQKKHDMTALTITHDTQTAQIMGDNLAFLEHGKIEVQCSVHQVQTHQHPLIKKFFQNVPLV